MYRKRSGLLAVLEEYDREREAYVARLELENRELRERCGELSTLLMRATDANDRKQLQLILAGHYDGLSKRAAAPGPGIDPGEKKEDDVNELTRP